MRYFIFSVSVHVLVISFIWVGFSVSQGNEKNSFTYLGDSVKGAENYRSSGPTHSLSKSSDVMLFDESSPAYFTPWLKMRDLNKPH